MATNLANISIKDNEKWNTYLDLIYPIGSYYFSNSSTSPANLLGGSWTNVTGRFLYANNGTGTGGKNTHTLTISEMPSHRHSAYGLGVWEESLSTSMKYGYAAMRGVNRSNHYGTTEYTSYTGSGSAHNNMPAYKECYCWYRTA